LPILLQRNTIITTIVNIEFTSFNLIVLRPIAIISYLIAWPTSAMIGFIFIIPSTVFLIVPLTASFNSLIAQLVI